MDTALLQEALRHVDQAAFALSEDTGDHARAVALAQLEQVRELLTAAAFEQATPPRAARDGDTEEDGPALVRRVRLDGDLRAASAARAFAATTCAMWAVQPAATSTVIDLVSELVSNAARHAGGSIELALERRDGHMLVTVHDGSDVPPRLLPYRRGVSEQGIGLRLVDQLSEAWGWQAAPDGKDVWARAALGERPPRPTAAARVPNPRRRAASTR